MKYSPENKTLYSKAKDIKVEKNKNLHFLKVRLGRSMWICDWKDQCEQAGVGEVNHTLNS